MKRLLLLTITLFSAALVNAQLVVDTAANWQQLIPTILGGNCVQISNVNYNAGQGTSAVYQNFPGFGNGILITTGKAIDALGPNTNGSVGTDNALGGNALLDTYAGGPTFDATTLSFNFVATQSDTVRVEYIFASEEYPEFVGSNFNDVFAFIVDEPGLASQNIALIPNTNTPVAINNLNANSFSSYYVDNTNGTDIQYDGYTVPLTAKFYAVAGINYTLTISIADVADGIFDSGVFLKSYTGGSQSLSGTVTHLGQPATAGYAELFGYNINQGAAPLVDSQPIINGSYTFDNVAYGAYNIRVTLDTTVYPGTYPLYYDSAYTWTDASIVSAPCTNYDLGMQLLVLQNGNGTVSGTIGNTDSQVEKANNGPLANAHVILAGLTDDNVYGFTLTNAAGYFSFTNIPDGSYKLLVDIPGLPMDSTRIITISNENKNWTNQSYLVGTNKIIVSENPLTLTETSVIKAIQLMPNPASNTMQVTFNLMQTGKLNIELLDITGKQVMSLYVGTMAEGTQTLSADISTLNNGVYMLRMVTPNGTITRKLIKTDN